MTNIEVQEDILKFFLKLEIEQTTALALETDPEAKEVIKKSLEDIKNSISRMQKELAESKRGES